MHPANLPKLAKVEIGRLSLGKTPFFAVRD
jgi:hypothetical protein